MKAVLAAAFAAFTLSACQAIETWPADEELATFGSNGSPIVIMDSVDNFGCGRIDLGFRDARTKAQFNRNLVTGEPRAIIAQPGVYRL
jgi:hypothetical protein